MCCYWDIDRIGDIDVTNDIHQGNIAPRRLYTFRILFFLAVVFLSVEKRPSVICLHSFCLRTPIGYVRTHSV